IDAARKTVPTMAEHFWHGAWHIDGAGHSARYVLGGVVLLTVNFEGTQDPTTRERLRAACDLVLAEGPVSSFHGQGGIGERETELALSSMQRQHPRRPVCVLTTNPGNPRRSWLFPRFFAEADPARVVCWIQPGDRLSPEEIAQRRSVFRV